MPGLRGWCLLCTVLCRPGTADTGPWKPSQGCLPHQWVHLILRAGSVGRGGHALGGFCMEIPFSDCSHPGLSGGKRLRRQHAPSSWGHKGWERPGTSRNDHCGEGSLETCMTLLKGLVRGLHVTPLHQQILLGGGLSALFLEGGGTAASLS